MWKVAAETGQGMGEGLVSEKTTLEGLFEGRSRDCSGRWRDWTQNRLVLRKYELETRSRDWSERWRDWSRNGLVGGSVFEGRSRDSSGWGRDWSQNRLLWREFLRVAAGTVQDGGGIGLRTDYFGGSF